MSRVIFLDKLVRSGHGHNLEYCLRVADAFTSAGYETVILGNKHFAGQKPKNLIPAIDFDWHRAIMGADRGQARRKSRAMARDRHRLQRQDRLLASPLGMAYQLLLDWREGGAEKERSPGLRMLAALLGMAAISARMALAAVWILTSPFRLGVRFGKRLSRPGRRALAAWWAPRAAVATERLRPRELIDILRRLRGADPARDPQHRNIARSIDRALKALRLTSADIVVCTTTVERDLGVYLDILKRSPATRVAHWNFIFREPIFLNEGPSFLISNKHRSLRTKLAAFSAFRDLRTDWWVDTDELAEQYSFLGIFDFGVLPIPMPDSMADFAADPLPRADQPLTIGYLGDARPEKGYGYLPVAIQELNHKWTSWLEAAVRAADLQIADASLQDFQTQAVGPRQRLMQRRRRMIHDVAAARLESSAPNAAPSSAQFDVLAQSNFNVPGGVTQTRAARYRLLSQNDLGVVVTAAPRNSAEYQDNLRKSDLLMLYYEHQAYHAGSSGIFAEAMLAGRPVVLNDNSWGGRRLRTSRQYVDHLYGLAERGEGRNVRFSSAELLNSSAIWRIVPDAATHIVALVDFKHSQPSDQLALTIEFRCAGGPPLARRRLLSARIGKAATIVRRPAQGCMYRLGIERLNASLSPDDWSVGLKYLALRGEPLGAVGQVCDADEITAALAEIGRHYEHYRRSATAFAADWAIENSCTLIADRIIAAAADG